MNPPSGMAEGLIGLFAAIAASGASAAEQRWLRRCAVESGATAIARSSTAPQEAGSAKSQEATFSHLDLVLAEVAGKAMMPLTPSVKVAKVWLREQGEHGRLLAGRLGRLSRRRNGAAHPDGALQRDIRALDIAVVSGELSSTPSSGGASHAGLGLAGLDDFPALVDEECEKDSDLPEQAKDSVVLVREVTDTTPLVEQSTKTIHEEVRPELAEKDITTGKDPSEVPDEPGKQQHLQFRDQACEHEALQKTASPGVAVARCSGTTSFSGSICAPRRSGPRRRASASQVECAMRAAGEQVPRRRVTVRQCGCRFPSVGLGSSYSLG